MNDLKRSYYAIIPANVRYDESIRPNAKLLYGEITALCNERGYCWASNQYFAELYKVSKTSISLWIKDLIHGGYITTELVYKEGSKEILHRYLRIVNDPTQQKLNTPIEEKLKDNNTSFNNTTNNTKDILPDTSDKTPKRKTKKEKAVKETYGEFENVLLTKEEYQKLLDRFPSDLKPRIEKLSGYVASTGKAYKSHYATIIMWAKKDEPKQRSRGYDTSEYDNFF